CLGSPKRQPIKITSCVGPMHPDAIRDNEAFRGSGQELSETRHKEARQISRATCAGSAPKAESLPPLRTQTSVINAWLCAQNVHEMCTPLALSFPIFELLTSVTAALIGSLLSHQNVIARFTHGLLGQLESRRALIGYSTALLERHSGANQLTFGEQAPNQRDSIRHAAGRW